MPRAPSEDASSDFKSGDYVWHYTSFDGLRGILQGNIWASHLLYLNDTQEFAHGIKIAIDDFKVEVEPLGFAELDFLATDVEQFFHRFSPDDLFVACFSRKPDDLSQWRAYGGTGPIFSLGFDPQQLKQIADQQFLQFERVLYDRSEIADEFRKSFPELRSEMQAQRDKAFDDKWRRKLAATWIGIAPKCKHPKFVDEQEYRLILRQSTGPIGQKPLCMHFRRSGSLVIPYVEFNLKEADPSPIKTIIIGPSPHPANLLRAVQYMVGPRCPIFPDNSSIEVTSSAIPFRNW